MVERLALKPLEVAEALGCSRAKAYELIASGEIESIKVGTDTRVPVTSLKAYVVKKLKTTAK